LYFDIENYYYKNAADFYSAAYEIHKIVLYDTSISGAKKKNYANIIKKINIVFVYL